MTSHFQNWSVIYSMIEKICCILAQNVPLDLEIFKQRYDNELRVYLEDNIRHRSTFNLWVEMIEEIRGKQ